MVPRSCGSGAKTQEAIVNGSWSAACNRRWRGWLRRCASCREEPILAPAAW